MKTSTATLLSSALLLAACIPQEIPVASAPVVLDRFEAASYVADSANTEDLQGLWIMTTKNYIDSVSVKNTKTYATSDTDTSGSFRMACTVILVGEAYSSTCFGAGDLALSSGSLVNTDGTWTATVTDNTHISGAYFYQNISRNNFKGIVTTSTTSMDFDMVKLHAAQTVLGNMNLTSNGVTESSSIVEFYETEFTEALSENDVIVSSDTMAIFNAFGSTGNLFGIYSLTNGASMTANTESLYVESSSATISTSENSTDGISMSISGEDTNNASFSGSIDISL